MLSGLPCKTIISHFAHPISIRACSGEMLPFKGLVRSYIHMSSSFMSRPQKTAGLTFSLLGQLAMFCCISFQHVAVVPAPYSPTFLMLEFLMFC